MVAQQGKISGILAVLLTSVLWGTTGTVATFATGASSFAIGSAALGIGGILQALIALGPLRKNLRLLLEHWLLCALGALSVALYALAFYSSMHYAGVAIGSVISLASAPLFSGILELIIDRRGLNYWWLLSAGLGVLGSVLLTLSKMRDSPELGLSTLAGISMGFVAGFTYACYTWVVSTLIALGTGRAASMGAVLGGGGLLLMPVLCLTGAPLIASFTNFAVATYMALIPMFLGYLLFGYGLTKIPASMATTITLSEPAVATILALWIVGEQLSFLGWLGLLLIGLVLLIMACAPSRK